MFNFSLSKDCIMQIMKREAEIYVNQIGYLPDENKYAYISRSDFEEVCGKNESCGQENSSTAKKEFSVVEKESGKILYTGSLKEKPEDRASGEAYFYADFSDFKGLEEDQLFYIEISGAKSFAFRIARNIYDSLYFSTLNFFKLSRYEKPLLKYYEEHPEFLSPKFRANEIINFVKSGLQDLSVTRTKVKWGIPVKSNPAHTIYVWFDALINYITAAGAGTILCEDKAEHEAQLKDIRTEKFEDLWPADIHMVGKEIFRFHSVIWPAVLMALGLPLPQKVFAHGWWTVEGEKMSKTLGNVINPAELAAKYGVDPVRVFLFREVPFGQDGDFSMASFFNRYNSDLANNIGNLLSRTLNMAAKNIGELPEKIEGNFPLLAQADGVEKAIASAYEQLAFDKVLEQIYGYASELNKQVNDKKPWEMAKTDPEGAKQILLELIACQRKVAKWLEPFMPTVAKEMQRRLAAGKIEKYAPLFPRLEK